MAETCRSNLNNNKLINEKLICAFRWSVLPLTLGWYSVVFCVCVCVRYYSYFVWCSVWLGLRVNFNFGLLATKRKTTSCNDRYLCFWRDLFVFHRPSLRVLRGLNPRCPGKLHSVYRGADKSLARPGRKQTTATEDFDFHISYL